jgi:hypothetical protein
MPFMASLEGQFNFGRAQRAPVTPIVTSGLMLNLDAGNPASYPGSGSTWMDLTGNARNATLFNTPTYSSAQGGYISFNDTSYEYAAISDIGSLNQWTIEAWARTNSSLSSRATAIVCNQFDLSTKLNFSMGLNQAYGSANMCIGFFNGAWRTTTGFAPTLNTWYHIVGTYDGSTVRQYTNAVLGTTLTYSGTPQSGGEIRIARRWDESATNNTNFFPGDISIVRIYNKALSQSEVTQNYDAIKSRYV